MTKKEFEKKLRKIKNQEEKFGVKITITDLIDKDHLNCVWYGGEVGTIKTPNGYTITIGAYGDIRLYGFINSEPIDIKDKSNSGSVYREIGDKVDDKRLHKLFESDKEYDYLEYSNNNWFEVDLISPDGEWIDLCYADNVLDDDLLDCFLDIETYLEYVEDVIKNQN